MESKENPINQEQGFNQEKLKVDCFVSTIACERHPDRNEDDSFFDASKGIFGIFDGMGGMNDGQWCAQTSCQTARENLNNNHHLLPSDAREILINASKMANEKVFKEYRGRGGSTATFGLICETLDGVNQIVLAHTGDSRAYLFRDNKLIKLTIDDGISKYASKEVQDEIDTATSRSNLSQQASNLFQTRNQISNFIGIGRDISPKIVVQSVLPNDLIVLTTDGVHDNLTTIEISQIISQNSKTPELISQKLTNAALVRSKEGVFRSKPDDMTALVTIFSKDKGKSSVIKTETAKPPEEFIPKIGQEIIRQRSNGDINGGWKISIIEGDKLTVTRHYKDDIYEYKTVTIDQVDRYNRPAKIEDISTSQNIQQLKFTITKLGGVKGTTNFFPADYLLQSIDEAFANNGSEESLQRLTRSGGLRDTVKKLIESKKENNK